ncbi:phage terminase large subunit family protein [Patescibacteria group bacterium]|nr:phage terminase large subunit family protein [Patescibacteria group bacterium]
MSDKSYVDAPPLMRSELAERLLHLDGAPFSLRDYPFYLAIYDGKYQGMLLKTARQVAKSTTLCNFTIGESISIPHFKTIFVAPSQEQTQRFSNTRLAKVVHYSPLVRRHFISQEFTDRTMLRMFKNGSEVTLTYACDDPDRARGPSGDRVCYDEVQDILYDAVIPVVNECLANSEYGYETYAGTPKTLENTIEYLWQLSSRTEWIMKCEGCNNWNFIDSASSVGKKGPICVKCGHLLNPRAGQWYDFNPTSRVKGFHISQPMLPRNMESPARWLRILDKLERYSETKFKNEVLGVSDALGARIIGKDELEALCHDYDVYRTPPPGLLKNIKATFGGIDWSGGGTEGISRTVLWIWGLTEHNRLRTLYHRIYPVASPVSILDDITEVLQAYGVNIVVGDRGEGHLANNLLAQRLGQHRVHQASYGSQATPLSWNAKGQFYTVDRTTMMDNYFMVLKRGGVEFPRLEHMREVIMDILNIYEEVTTSGKKVWRHSQTLPDDAFHAQLFGWLAAKIFTMDLTFSG